LTKIDKSKINNHKNGSAYYNIDIFIKDEKDQYGNDCAISQSQSKEEREAKKRRCTSVMARVFGMAMRVPKVRTKLTCLFKLGLMKNLFTFEK
jgi:hypothetical protein